VGEGLVLAFLFELKVPAKAVNKRKSKTEPMCRQGNPTLLCVI
jgi:hypothetical protein